MNLSPAETWDLTVPWLPIYWDIDILARYHRAGYTFVSLTLQDWPPTLDGTAKCITRFRQIAQSAEDWLVFVATIDEIDRARRDGKLAVGFNSQDTILIGDDISKLADLRALGICQMLLAYNVRNFVADGCAETADAGLSNFGRRVVREMNRVGLVVDCAHTGRRSSLEAIELSATPVIFSHSGASAVHTHYRNIDDDQIRACAARGGVVGVVGVGAYLGDPEARAETLYRHVDHIAALVGSEHVAIGSDYVGIFPASHHGEAWARAAAVADVRSWPEAVDAWPAVEDDMPVQESRCFAPEQLADLIQLLHAHGYSEHAIAGILGGNARRVYVAAEAAVCP